MAFVGNGVNNGDILIWDSATNSWRPGAQGSGGGSGESETFPISLGEQGRTAWSGFPTAGRFFATAFISSASFTLNRLATYVVQGNTGTLGMALYDNAGNIVAPGAQSWDGVSSAFNNISPGFNVFDVQTPALIAAEQLYYIGMTFRTNGVQYLSCENRINTGTPLFGVEDDNGNAGANMRNTFNPNSNGRTYRYWGAALQ